MSDSPNPYAPPTAAPSTQGSEWLRNDPAALSTTALGLSIVYYGIVLILLSIIFGAFLLFVVGPLAVVVSLGVLLGSLMGFIGPFLCLTVPAATKARWLIIASVLAQALFIIPKVLSFAGIQIPDLDWVTLILNLFSMIFFVLFMRKLSQFIGREDLTKRAERILALGLILTLAAIIGAMLFFATGPAIGYLFLVLFVVALILFVSYANLINSLSKALRDAKTLNEMVQNEAKPHEDALIS